MRTSFSGIITTVLLLLTISCTQKVQDQSPQSLLLFKGREYPFATIVDGTYYYTMQSPEDNILLYQTNDLTTLPSCTPKVI